MDPRLHPHQHHQLSHQTFELGKMGFFDSLSDLWEAAAPWSQGEAEAVSGGSSEEKTPAQKDDGGEGEALDPSGPTPDKKDNGGEEEEADSKEDNAEEEPEEEEEEELEDPKEKFEEECKESKTCAPLKHHFDECVERVTGAVDKHDKKHPNEDCVEEFFHLAHCANQCAAPKLWAALK